MHLCSSTACSTVFIFTNRYYYYQILLIGIFVIPWVDVSLTLAVSLRLPNLLFRGVQQIGEMPVGHNNPKQGIQYHLRLKGELEELRRECTRLLRDKFHLEECVRYCKEHRNTTQFVTWFAVEVGHQFLWLWIDPNASNTCWSGLCFLGWFRYLAARCQLYEGCCVGEGIGKRFGRNVLGEFRPRSLVDNVRYSTSAGKRLHKLAARGKASVQGSRGYKNRVGSGRWRNRRNRTTGIGY